MQLPRALLRLAGLVLALFTTTAFAERDMAYEAELEARLSAINPALLAPFQQARLAMDANDSATALPLLREVVAGAPQFDPALRRLGGALNETGHRDEGHRFIEQAVAIERNVANLVTLAYALASRPRHDGNATNDELRRALQLLEACRTLPRGDDEDVHALTVQINLQLHDLAGAARAHARLKQVAPDSVGTHYLGAYVAAAREDWIEAEDEMRAAGRLGVDAATVEQFLATGVHRQASTWRWVHRMLWLITGWAAGLATLSGLGFALSRVTLRQIERADPRVAISPGERRMRRVYRQVLNLAGLYYYISLPVVILIVIGTAAAIVYGFFMAGTIPIKLVALIVIGAIATVFTMIRSLFVRVDHRDPGRALKADEAPGLWQLSLDVARDLDTQPIDEIRVTPGTELCVYERGTWRDKLRGDAERILVVGTGVLTGFKTADFRSVLAHEYGHFANQDTAGGDIALRVQNDMNQFYRAMVEAGQASMLNLAFHFLRIYHFVFLRVSHGASRLQEVLADRVAAIHYGPAAFESGLRHVVRRSVEFHVVANQEIDGAIKEKRPVSNLYVPAAIGNDFVTKEYEDAITRPTSLDDTHPGPMDRFRLISTLPEPASLPIEGMVWDLFKDRDALTAEMMTSIEGQIVNHRA